MDTETATAIGKVEGLVEGLGKEVGGIRGQLADLADLNVTIGAATLPADDSAAITALDPNG